MSDEVSFGPLRADDIAAADQLLAAELGGRFQARLGQIHDVLAVPGVAAWEGQRLIGVATYVIEGGQAELAAIAVAQDRRSMGIGGRLIEATATAVALHGVGELWLVTTNDNLDALRLYQRHGFRLAELHAGAIDQARQLKPGLGEARNALVVRASDAVVAVGGSWGALSELAFAMRMSVPVVTLQSWSVVDAAGAELAGITRASSAAEAVRAALAGAGYSGR